MDALSVLHVVQRYPPALGGSESYFARLSRYLAEAGDNVTVWTTTALDLEALWSPRGRCLSAGKETKDGVVVTRFPLWRMPGRRLLLKPLSWIPLRRWQCLTLPCNPISYRLWSATRTPQACDVVHATAFPYAYPIVCALRCARRQGVPFLLTPFLHLGDPEDRKDPTRRAYLSPSLLWLLRQADGIFVQTPSEREALRQRGIAEHKLLLLGLGVDPAECTGGNRLKARLNWRVEPGQIVIGHLANNSEEKGSVDLLKAAAVCFHRGRNFQLVLAGPEMPNFRRFWRSYSFARRVIRLGVLDDQQKKDFWAGIDVFALPSRSDSFGLVLLEAWANGVPNVGYRAGGIADVIRHEEDGLLVRCGDLEGLAAALTRLASDAVLRQHLGEAGRQRTLRDFRWEEKLCRVREVYRELATSPKRQRAGKSSPSSLSLGAGSCSDNS